VSVKDRTDLMRARERIGELERLVRLLKAENHALCRAGDDLDGLMHRFLHWNNPVFPDCTKLPTAEEMHHVIETWRVTAGGER
jgi:hypothetical protein